MDCKKNMKISHSISKILGLSDEVQDEKIDFCHSVENVTNNRDELNEIKNGRSRARRARTNFNKEAINYLEQVFKVNPYPDINERERLAEKVDTTEARIQVWFQNKRSRNRRKTTKSTVETCNESFTSGGSMCESLNTSEPVETSPIVGIYGTIMNTVASSPVSTAISDFSYNDRYFANSNQYQNPYYYTN